MKGESLRLNEARERVLAGIVLAESAKKTIKKRRERKKRNRTGKDRASERVLTSKVYVRGEARRDRPRLIRAGA